eukprot:TRINITY_DN20635_c0_g1_i1.p1 TRINITY_DN20635_c0_g1~~TRINITY_DN20635_c0_g1_i1.p1  ORF type:complete len:427 (+),score=68.37 TRINITY_DN20635_c0_g1_i1:71-1351(+)
MSASRPSANQQQLQASYTEKLRLHQVAEARYESCKQGVRILREQLVEKEEKQVNLHEDAQRSQQLASQAAAAAKLAQAAFEKCRRKLEQAMAAEQGARQQLQTASGESDKRNAAAQACTRRLSEHKSAAKDLRNRLERQNDELSAAETEVQNRKGHVRAAHQALQESMQSQAPEAKAQAAAEAGPPRQGSGALPLPLPTWTAGKIYSSTANEFIRGYPHKADSARTQSFVLHLDTGNSGPTIISKVAFDFLGLARSSQQVGTAQLRGIGGVVQCPVYEIRYCVDVVNQLKPGTILQRTVKAAVLKESTWPGQVGHYDMLLNAEDTRKFSAVVVNGRGLHLQILSAPPITLYDGQPLLLQAPFSSTDEGRKRTREQMAHGVDLEDLFRLPRFSFNPFMGPGGPGSGFTGQVDLGASLQTNCCVTAAA